MFWLARYVKSLAKHRKRHFCRQIQMIGFSFFVLFLIYFTLGWSKYFFFFTFLTQLFLSCLWYRNYQLQIKNYILYENSKYISWVFSFCFYLKLVQNWNLIFHARMKHCCETLFCFFLPFCCGFTLFSIKIISTFDQQIFASLRTRPCCLI